MTRHLRNDEKAAIVAIVEQAGIAEVLRLLAGLIVNAIPNLQEEHISGRFQFGQDARHALCSLAHAVAEQVDDHPTTG